MQRALNLFYVAGALCAAASAQQSLVVPAAFATTDAPAYGWVAGASRPVRQQTLIGASHLAPLLGQAVRALELRRHAANEIYVGGSADMTVTLSIAPHLPVECSSTFADNRGAGAVQVFSGTVALPTSPPATSPNVAWTPDNVIRIEFQTPFLYSGGTLCVDIVGLPIPGQNANWWMADLQLENIGGTFADLGGGCGLYGGVDKNWSSVSRRSLLPGAHARFSAYGTPGGFAIAAFGSRSPVAVPLVALGFPADPSCTLQLQTLDALMFDLFWPPSDPADLSYGGEAEIQFKVPASAAVFGASMTTQWLDWTQMATSNAIEWTVGSVIPTLDMAQIDGHATDPRGIASPHLAHVMRFEFL